jgi:hypothetical protein
MMAKATVPPVSDLLSIWTQKGNRRALIRLFGWGSAAVVALAALALTTQTEGGNARLQSALATDSRPDSQAVAQIPVKSPEIRLLEEQVRMLAADRDRLAARLSVIEPRIATIEHSLDDMTGSIRKQVEQTAALAAKVQSTPEPTEPPRMVNPVRTETIKIERPKTVAPAPLVPPNASAAPAEPPVAEVPMPPARVAAMPPQEPPPEAPKKPEIGVDIGGAPNMDVLNMRWTAVKANFGPLLNGLHPLAAHVKRQNATDLRLLVGPLPNIAAANQLCTRFAAARVTCRPTKFDGEQIAQH